MHARHAPLLAAAIAAFSSGCGEDPAPAADLDPNVLPVTTGTWYRPTVATTWQWQLAGSVNTAYDVDLYDVDLFDAPQSLIDSLHTDGRSVLCYFSAGSSEDWRSDFGDFDDRVLGEPLDGWDGERWLDIRTQNVIDIMKQRIADARAKGCDAVEPDNVDGYDNNSGFELTAGDQLAFNRFLANEARSNGIGIALKNEGAQAAELVDYFDLTLNEECHEYNECSDLAVFITDGKPVLNAEYAANLAAAQSLSTTLCPQAIADSHRTLILPLDLDDAFRVSCD